MSAYWQLNDPDWVPWFVYYVFAAVAALLVPRHERGWQMAAALCVIALLWAGFIGREGLDPITWEELTGDLSMKTLNVERWREIGGLLLVMSMLGGLVMGARLDVTRGKDASPS